MKTKNIKIVTRLNCPETNSSSSHCFVYSWESLKPSDLLLSTQTLIPITTSGKRIITLNGKKDEYEIHKRVNDSKSKALYAIGSARSILGKTAANKKVEEIKDIIKETLAVDEVIVSHVSSILIDHQSSHTLEPIIYGDREGLKEFIFNPRTWLFLLYDSEDCVNNPIFDVCKGYFNYEVSIDLPILVKRFRASDEINLITQGEYMVEYPKMRDLNDFYINNLRSNGYIGYSILTHSMIRRETQDYYGSLSFSYINEKSANNPNILEYLGVYSDQGGCYLAYINSTQWENLKNNYVKSQELPKEFEEQPIKYNEKFTNTLRDYNKWFKSIDPITDSKNFLSHILAENFRCTGLTDELLNTLGITKANLKLFKIKIYSRKLKDTI